jgi:hypothetical protein
VHYQVFEAIGNSSDTQFLVRASFLEIYNEQVRDLLGKDPSARLELKEHRDTGVYVKGLGSFVVKSVQEMTALLEVKPVSNFLEQHRLTCHLTPMWPPR